jgi:exosortase
MSKAPVTLPYARRAPRGAALSPTILAVALGLLACVLWSYWPVVVELREFWSRNADYSVGQLVPPVAAFLVWRRRAALAKLTVTPAWAGAVLVVVAEALRLASVYFAFGSGPRYSLVLSIAGVVLLSAGWAVFRCVFWILVFLLLMVPLPARVHETIALPLQDQATAAAAFALETLGYFVVREGHVLRLDDQSTVAVTEACSGLRMLTAFVFVAAVFGFLVDRPRWQKAVLLASSIPIAVLANAARVVVTAMFVHSASDPSLGDRFHDAAGLAMMPLALVILYGLLRLLSALTTPGRPVPKRVPTPVAAAGRESEKRPREVAHPPAGR